MYLLSHFGPTRRQRNSNSNSNSHSNHNNVENDNISTTTTTNHNNYYDCHIYDNNDNNTDACWHSSGYTGCRLEGAACSTL